MDEQDVERLLTDVRIVRNRAKIEATISNARILLSLHGAGRSLSEILWSYARVEKSPPEDLSSVPAHTTEAAALSKELRALGSRFIGPTMAYAGLQATGVVNDHLLGCHVRSAVERERAEFVRHRQRA